MRNDARPIGVDSPASPVGGDEEPSANRLPDEEPTREEPPAQQKPDVKEPPDPTEPADDPTIRTEM